MKGRNVGLYRRPAKRLGLCLALAGGGVLLLGEPALAQDAEPTAADVQGLLDNVWVLVAAVLVIFMQAGFALVEAGLTRAKSVGNIMMKNLMDFAIGVMMFFCFGFAIAFGGGFDGFGKFFGGGGWFLGDGAFTYGNLSPFVFFMFQVAFAATAATIVSGAMAERTKFVSYLVYSAVITGLLYPIVVRWQWGGGWLFQLDTPFHDFAGSAIVHMVGGMAALAGAAVLGPRIGKYGKDGKPRAILGHNIAYAVLGALILLVGWFGFNPGSYLGADAVIGEIATTTVLAGSAGALVAMFIIWIIGGKPDVSMTANGLLAGLVGVTAGCWAVSTVGAIVIGAVSGALVVGSVFFFDRVLKIDDPVGAISVHGICGAWGVIAVGLFSAREVDGVVSKGLFYGGGVDQLVSQVIGVVSIAAFVLVTGFALFLAIKHTIGLRVPPQEEMEGLDMVEHGAPGYADDSVTGNVEDYLAMSREHAKV